MGLASTWDMGGGGTFWNQGISCFHDSIPADAVALTSGFTNAVGQIWLTNVRCRGTESRLTDCAHSAFGLHNCNHYEDAGVRCTSCTQGAVRLEGGNSTSGRVEICHNNIWGTVCDRQWSQADVEVVCKQLGFEATG
jgi:deleted-in-malignant-brain-tumors protein 1